MSNDWDTVELPTGVDALESWQIHPVYTNCCAFALRKWHASRHSMPQQGLYKCQWMTRSNKFEVPSRLITMFSNFPSPFSSTTQLVVSLASFLLVYGIYKIFAFLYDELTSPLRHVPGPPSPSFIYGSMKQLSESVSWKLHWLASE